MIFSQLFKNNSVKTMGKKTLIGEGSYGCVVKPPIIADKYVKKYVEYTDIAEDDVSKLFKNNEVSSFKNELKILIGVQKIDPDNLFTVKLKGANSFDSYLLENNEDVYNCLEVSSNEKSDIYQIILENGGKEISKLPKNSINYSEMILALIVFLENLKKMHSVDLIHRDIKPMNVLYNKSKNKLSLIDFGISEDANSVYSIDNASVLSYIYPYYPPEFYISFLLLKYRNDKVRFQQKLDDVLLNIENEYLIKFFEKSKIPAIMSSLEAFINEIKLKDYGFYDVFNASMAYKSDIYALSSIIKELANKIVYDNEKQNIGIHTLYKMCSEINPYKRPTIDNILNYIYEIKTITIGGCAKCKGTKNKICFRNKCKKGKMQSERQKLSKKQHNKVIKVLQSKAKRSKIITK